MNPIAEDILMHYGIKRRSGRYPWGSGKEPYQHSGDLLSRVEELKSQGLSEKKIAETIGLSTTDLRMQVRVANHERKQLEYERVKALMDDGITSPTEIGRIIGKSESTVRSMLKENTVANRNRASATADILVKELESKGRMLDVGAGTENVLGVSPGVLKEALFILETRGYKVYGVGASQMTNKQQSNAPVLCKPDVEYKELYQKMGDIQMIGDYHSIDGGASYNKTQYPASIDSNRVHIRYGDEGGASKDGVMEIRRGVADLDLGNSHYAQVRILVDGTHYLKGMAMYSDNMPDGADIVFNTNKLTGTDKMKVLKKIKDDDPDNPFGANIKAGGQSTYIDKDGVERLSAINKLKEEGDWDTASSKNLSSQFLSKQPMSLIKRQLKLTYQDALDEYNDICSLENPTIKKKLLLDFADNCDGAAVHLKAAALPRQKTQVLLPLDDIKDTEIYAPNFNNGEKVSLIRYPHGGIFEIPTLTVNNRNKAGKSILGVGKDAVGINSKVAEQLSGADFDGDTVVVIPNSDKVHIKNKKPLEGLIGFDPKVEYSTEGMTGVRLMKKSEKQKQMGMVSNLITDMTLQGAPESDITKAVKHSMVVIDAEKHKLDFKRSEKENDIDTLKAKYQRRVDEDGNVKVGGASTLLSRKKQDIRVPETQGAAMIDPETGKVSYKLSGRTYIDRNGNEQLATKTVKLMSTIDDAHELSSGTNKENAYADYANSMKALANTARKTYKATGNLEYSASANATYKEEVNSLLAKLNNAAKNAPRERRALYIANSVVKAKIQDNPDMDKAEIKKLKQRELTNARLTVGSSSKSVKIKLTDREWEAIQAGAISDSRLSQILRYTDDGDVRERATPRTTKQVSPAQETRIKHLAASGYTYAEIADIMGKSTSTISKYLN